MGSHFLTETFLCRSLAPSLFLMVVPLAREPTVMLMASGKTSLNCPLSDKRTKIGRQAEAHLPHAVRQEIPALSPRKDEFCDTMAPKVLVDEVERDHPYVHYYRG